MAEIPLQQKERRNPLPLIIAALVLLALVAWYFMRDRPTAGTGADSTGATTGVSLIDATGTQRVAAATSARTFHLIVSERAA